MPFTFSHPSLVVPLLYAHRRYKWLSATGLIIGSMAPDAEKFLRLKLASQHSHTIASIFYFSCPVSLGLAFVFHMLVRRPLIQHLPAPLYRRVSRYTNFDWPSYWRQHTWGVLLSIVIGATSHLFWDSFTHDNTLITSAVPESADFIRLGSKVMPVWQLVALVSTVIGALIIGYVVWKMPVNATVTVPDTSAVLSYWSIIAFIAACLETGWVLAVHPRWLNIGISTVTATMIGIIITSVYTTWRSRRLRTNYI
jgi:hypothetical protein